MPLVDVETGARLHYEDLRPGSAATPVIAMPGLLGRARDQLGASMDWLHERGFRVMGLTLRGYGDSLPKPRDFPDNFYHRDCGDLLAFMDALQIKRAHLLGYSDGGEVALIAAGKYPERVASCLAIGAIGHFGAELRPVFQRVYPGGWISESEKRVHGIVDPARFTGAWLRSMTRMIDAGGDVSLSMAHEIACPLLLMLGRNDKLNPAHYGQRFVKRVKHGQLALLDCGHAVQDHLPEEFRRLALRHLLAAEASQNERDGMAGA